MPAKNRISKYPEHKDMYYPINYGYVGEIIAPDGEEQYFDSEIVMQNKLEEQKE